MNVWIGSAPTWPGARSGTGRAKLWAVTLTTAMLAIAADAPGLAQAPPPAQPAQPAPKAQPKAQPKAPPQAPAPAPSGGPEVPPLTYSPWTKVCLKGPE